MTPLSKASKVVVPQVAGAQAVRAGEDAMKAWAAAGRESKPTVVTGIVAMQPRPLKEFIDSATAAKIAGVSMATVKRWAERGYFKGYRVGARWRINRQSLISYLESCQMTHRSLEQG